MSGRRHRTLRALWLAAASATVLGLAVVAAILLSARPTPRQSSQRTADAPDAALASAIENTAAQTTIARRHATLSEDLGDAQPRPTAVPTFDEYVDRIVERARALRRAVENEKPEQAREIDDACRSLVEDLERDYPNAGDLCLFAMGGLEPLTSGPPGMRFSTLHFLLARALQRREGEVAVLGRAALDGLVAKALDLVPKDATTAAALAQLVTTGESRLGLAHEDAVLSIASLVPEDPWLSEPATSLLRALWANLERSGARTSAELAALALLFKDDTNPSRRIAAFESLLTLADGRYRELVFHDVATRGDRDAAVAVLQLAADKLPVPVAIEALHRLGDLASDSLLGPCLTLADRGGEEVRGAYETLLAGGTDPGLRAELVSGLGLAGDATGIRMARLAFDQDPDPKVRERALFALTASAPSSHGLDAWEAAANNPRNRTRRGAGTLVLALDNLAGSSDPDVRLRVARWAHELRSMDWVGPTERDRLGGILAKAEPR